MASRGTKVGQSSNLTFRMRGEVEIEQLLTQKWDQYVKNDPVNRSDDLATWNDFLDTLDPGEKKIVQLLFDVKETGPVVP